MTERAWQFGDVVRVNPAKYLKTPQPDDRRWMVIASAWTTTWTAMYLGPGSAAGQISHWTGQTEFIRVEDDE